MDFKHEILNAMQAISVDTANIKDEDTFGENVGMDSQEMVELLFFLSKKLKVKFPTNFIHRQMTIREATIKLEDYIGPHISANTTEPSFA